MSILEQTAQFMFIGGQEEALGLGDLKVRTLRMNLLGEEVLEYKNAELADDPVEIADGLCDIIVVAMGTLISYYGLAKTRKLLAEVGASNMSKFELVGGQLKAIKNSDGKILKGPGYFAPRIAEILAS